MCFVLRCNVHNACVLHGVCLAQLSICNMEKRYRNNIYNHYFIIGILIIAVLVVVIVVVTIMISMVVVVLRRRR